MFLAVILVCHVDGSCKFFAQPQQFPTLFSCKNVVIDGEFHFEMQPKVDYAEGRCIRWGSLVGDSK